MNLPRNLPALLRAAGLTVVEVDGWETRGRPASTGGFAPVGVLNHHTGASARGWSLAKELVYAKWMFLTGRPNEGLPAPLVQMSLGRSGTVYLGAAGRSNHAGTAKASGSVKSGDGNFLYTGIEWMLSGTEDIPAEMMAAGVTLNAVLTEHVTDGGKGTSVETISCHYNTSVTGKWDIGDPNGVRFGTKRVLDIRKFRNAVAARRKALYHAPLPQQPHHKPATLDMVTFNVWVGNAALEKNLTALIKDTRSPAVLALQEVNGPVNIKGYTTLKGADTTALLLRNKDVGVLRHGVLDAADYGSPGWRWGPKDRKTKDVHHQPKQYPWARIQYDGQQWLVLAGHRVVSGFRLNKAEWTAEDSALLHWFTSRPATPCIAGMDWNDTIGSGAPLGVASLVERLGATSALHRIDGFVGHGVSTMRSKVLDGLYGSDTHHPIHVTITK